MERLELNVLALELARLMLSLSLERDCVCGFQSERRVHVCQYQCVRVRVRWSAG